MRAAVITVSDRSAAGAREDLAGPVAVRALRAAGFDCEDPAIIPDGAESVRDGLLRAHDAGARLIVTCGGTGIAPRDRTPEGTAEVLERTIPGIPEELRRVGAAAAPGGLLSRGLAGVAGRAFIVNLPGSPAAVRDGIAVVLSVAGHVLEQLDGSDHAVADHSVADHQVAPVADVRIARISADPLALDAHLRAVDDPRMGAETSFVGRVRDHDPDAETQVVALEYSAHPDAERILAEVAARVSGRTGTIIAVSHRTGRLAVGDVAVVIAVAAAHRAEAFDACRAMIEEIKRDLPVWKRQITADGSAQWKGMGG